MSPAAGIADHGLVLTGELDDDPLPGRALTETLDKQHDQRPALASRQGRKSSPGRAVGPVAGAVLGLGAGGWEVLSGGGCGERVALGLVAVQLA